MAPARNASTMSSTFSVPDSTRMRADGAASCRAPTYVRPLRPLRSRSRRTRSGASSATASTASPPGAPSARPPAGRRLAAPLQVGLKIQLQPKQLPPHLVVVDEEDEDLLC